MIRADAPLLKESVNQRLLGASIPSGAKAMLVPGSLMYGLKPVPFIDAGSFVACDTRTLQGLDLPRGCLKPRQGFGLGGEQACVLGDADHGEDFDEVR